MFLCTSLNKFFSNYVDYYTWNILSCKEKYLNLYGLNNYLYFIIVYFCIKYKSISNVIFLN